MNKSLTKLIILGAILTTGVWLAARPTAPAAESSARLAALRGLAPARPQGPTMAGPAPEAGAVAPVTVDLSAVAAGANTDNGLRARWLRGEVDLSEDESILPPAEMAALREAALRLPASAAVQAPAAGELAPAAPTIGVNFQSIDYTQSGGFVPPDPELAAGPNHLIAAVNTVFAIYSKSGAQLRAPTDFATLMGSNILCTGFLFDPNVLYDEAANRFILGIDANGSHYCLAASATADPLGSWRIYAFPTAGGSDFFDYPHAGIGRDHLFMGANIFGTTSFSGARLWAIDKADLYAGQAADYASKPLPISEDTPQPLHLHGWNQGTWPTSAAHYFFTDTEYNGETYSVWRWNNPLGGGTPSRVGTVNLDDYTNVTSGMPVDAPQSGSAARIQANDFRPHDFEYRDGFAWSAQTIACNPGSGTVNCLRWVKIDPATATIADAGVLGSNGQHRIFGNLAVNRCGDMAIGYTKTGSALFPSIFVTGRLAGDPAHTLQAETQVRAGAITYTAFDGSPHRWGDYTGMTIDPDGLRFWYLGQYSKNTGTADGRWATNVAALTFEGCSGGGGGTALDMEVSAKTGGSIGGVDFTPADILAYDGATGQWTVQFDASDVTNAKNLAAFARQDRTGQPDLYYLVFSGNQNIPGLGTVTPFDVVRFTPTQLGATTAGTFAWHVDGSDIGLTQSGEKIDALSLDGNRLFISTAGAASVPRAGGGNLRAADEDVIAFTPVTTGQNTAGSWGAYFDGSAAAAGLATEDVTGFYDDPASNAVYVTLGNAFNLSGISGGGGDVVKLTPSGGGSYTATLAWDDGAASFGFVLDAVELVMD